MLPVLTDAQWAKFEAAIAAVKLRGARPRTEDRRTIEAIIWRLDNRAKWRSIPAELDNWHYAYLRFRRWAVRGVWAKIMAHLVAEGEPQFAALLPAAKRWAVRAGLGQDSRRLRCGRAADRSTAHARARRMNLPIAQLCCVACPRRRPGCWPTEAAPPQRSAPRCARR